MAAFCYPTAYCVMCMDGQCCSEVSFAPLRFASSIIRWFTHYRFGKCIPDPSQPGTIGGHLVPCSWGCPEVGADDQHTGCVVMYIVTCMQFVVS